MLDRANWRHLCVLGIVLLAAFLRLWQIRTIPPGFHLDESYHALEALRILTEPGYHPFYLRGNFGPLPANAYLNVLTFWLFSHLGGEPGPTAMRITAATIGTLTVLAIFGLAVELRRYHRAHGRILGNPASHSHGVDRRVFLFACASALGLAMMRWHIHYSRMGIESIYVPFTWTVSAWLLVRGWRTGSWLDFAASGTMVGIGMYTYRGAWVIPLILSLSIAHLLLASWQSDKRSIRQKERRISGLTLWSLIMLWAVALLLVTSPLLIYFYLNNPDLFFVRLAQVNIVGNTGSPADATLMDNWWNMARMFGPFGSPGDLDPRRNLPGAAALSWPFAICFYIGIGVSLWRIRNPMYSLLLIGLVGLLLPGVFSEYAPHFHRVLGASAPAALLCAVGLECIWDWLSRGFKVMKLQRPQTVGLGLVVMLLLGGGGLLESYTYFGRWAKMSSLYYAFDVGLWEVGNALAAEAPETPIYISPRGVEHPTIAFPLRRQNPTIPYGECKPVSFDGRYAFPFTEGLNVEPELYAIIEHEDFRTSLLMPGIFPDAVISQEFLDADKNVYARIYRRPAMNQPAREPQQNVDILLGDGIRLLGFDVQPAEIHPGEIIYLQLHWSVEEKPMRNWTVFTHVRTNSATNAQRVAGHDSTPGNGSLPTECWLPGWRLLDEYQIQLPENLPPGEYELYTGMYEPREGSLFVTLEEVRLGLVQVLAPN